MEDELRALLQRDAIRRSIERLARGEDRRDADLIKSCWWPDADFDYGVNRGKFDAYLEWVVPGAEAILDTQHILGQSHFERAGEAWLVETHVISNHRVDFGEESGGIRDLCIGGRYLDRFEARQGEWRIAERTMLYDWSQDFGEAADWTQGVMGYPFGDDRFPGRAVDDWSETFFRQKSG